MFMRFLKNEEHQDEVKKLEEIGASRRLSWTLAWLSTALVLLLGLAWLAQVEAETFAYVTNQNNNTVSVIRTSDNTVVDTVPVGTTPYQLAITPNGAFAYVANNLSDNVSVILTSENMVVDTVPVGNGPWAVAITPNGAFAYVRLCAGTDNLVKVIRTSDNTVVATVPVGTAPAGVAITPDGAFAYVTNSNSANVSVIRTSDNTVVATVPMGAGTGPWGVAIGPALPTLTLTGCTSCRAGDRFTVQARVTNPGSHDVPVEAKVGVRTPNGTMVNVLGNKHLEASLPAGLDTTFTLFDVPSFPGGLPTGGWTVEGTFLEPELGETFSRDVKAFNVVP